jgi:hypothetical protein
MNDYANAWRCRCAGVLTLSLTVSLVLLGCNRSPVPETASSALPAIAPFLDAAAETGLVFQHHNGMSGKFYMPEMMGSGVAIFDYNNDGKMDIFLVQGGPLGPDQKPDSKKGPTHRLFRNDLEVMPDGTRKLKFTDVTEAAGLNFADYGMGVIAGDYDGDGFVDLYVTCLGKNRLLHNNGNGTFTDVTEAAGVGDVDAWHTSAAWVDFDRDGKLDLFVCRYVEWDFTTHRVCTGIGRGEDYCSPQSFSPERSRLFHNLGNGRFKDVSLASHIAGKAAPALGVVCTDINGDGWPDLFVANDGQANHCWINQHDGTFVDEALMRGCAVDPSNKPEANMGIIAADFRNRGLDDLFITHLKNERSALYLNQGKGIFTDASMPAGLDSTTRGYTGFGTCALDYDNDGWLDIFTTNGEVRVNESQARAGIELPLRQRCLLFHNRGSSDLRFEEITEGAFLKMEDVGRGLALGDLKNDGSMDLVVTNNNAPVRLLLNQAGQKNHWLGLRLVESAGGRKHAALGAVAHVVRSGLPTLTRRCATDGSYLSSSDPRLLFGLGAATAIESVSIIWPDGKTEEFTGLAVDHYHELVRGAGSSKLASKSDGRWRVAEERR